MTTPARGTLLLFSDTLPIDRGGSFVVFRRHLLPLVKSGWRLSLVSHYALGESQRPEQFWDTYLLPQRRPWYWPPTSRYLLALNKLRLCFMERYLVRRGLLQQPKPYVLLTNTWDTQALLAAHFARRALGKLGVFMHDDEVQWNLAEHPLRYLQWARHETCAAASAIWPVSTRLGDQLPPTARPKCRVLRPIPSDRCVVNPVWKSDYARIHVGYAGKVYPGLWPTLVQLAHVLAARGGQLSLVFGAEPPPPELPPNVTLVPFFATADAAHDWLVEHCSSVLVAHPTAGRLPAGSWQMLRSSFPSKLGEAVRLGRPLVLVGDLDSEFAEWAQSETKIPFFPDVQGSQFAQYLDRIQTESGWLAAAQQARDVAERSLSPHALQSAFAADIHSLAGGH